VSRPELRLPEFIGLMAFMAATVAISIDAVLPAFPQMAADLVPEAPNRVQLVLSFFVVGMGLGTVVMGPVSDAFGRLPVITGGFLLYIAAALGAAFATDLGTLLAFRALQGFAAAAPRIVSLALIRDRYEGRRMAQIVSFVSTAFMLVPAAAPSLGALILMVSTWQGVFFAYVGFGAIGIAWLNLRQSETLPRDRRRPLGRGPVAAAGRQVFARGEVVIYTAVMTLGFGQIFVLLQSTQPVYDQIFDQGASFPLWFMGTALVSAAGTVLNGGLVMRLGMRRLALAAYATTAVVTGLMIVMTALHLLPANLGLIGWFVWSSMVFFSTGLTFGNLNALALQRLGSIAGMAASVINAVATVGSMVMAIPVGLAFDGTVYPVMIGVGLSSGLAFLLLRRTVDSATPV
jgi:DHA1 family bicyclomycin/chloramphenicol resistance-like MFS transporter